MFRPSHPILVGFITVTVNSKENKIYPTILHKGSCLSSTIRGSGALEIKHWSCRETGYLNCFNVPHLTLHSSETKQKRVQPSLSPVRLMVYSEQVRRRRWANEDTLQYLHSFVENIDTIIVISVELACLCRFRVLYNIRSHSGERLLPSLTPVPPSDGSCSSSEHDHFITAPHARKLGHRAHLQELVLIILNDTMVPINRKTGPIYVREMTAVNLFQKWGIEWLH